MRLMARATELVAMPRGLSSGLLAPAPLTRMPFTDAAQPGFRHYSKNSNTLNGRNIFQLRAAQAVQETATPSQAPEIIDLPTSDESDNLLRIRHSVSSHTYTMMLLQHQPVASDPGMQP